jgi:hypothetical protein
MQTITCIVLALSLAGQATSHAWEDLRQHIGVAVVVRETDGAETFGRLLDVTADALTISVGTDTQSVLKINACDVSLLRRDRSNAAGWIVGLTLAGLVAGILISKTVEGTKPAPFVLAGAGVGTLIGMNGTRREPLYRRVPSPSGCDS